MYRTDVVRADVDCVGVDAGCVGCVALMHGLTVASVALQCGRFFWRTV